MKYLLVTAFLVLSVHVFSQEIESNTDSMLHHLVMKSGLLVASDENIPFWMAANTSQRFSNKELSQVYNNLYLFKPSRKGQSLDYNYGLEMMFNFDGKPNLRLIQVYAGLSTNWLNFTIGRKEEMFGLNDSNYGFGHLTNGYNALPMPKVSISTNGWKEAPFLTKNLSYKVYLSHGWFEKDRYQSGAFLHQKYLYLSIHPKSKKFELQFGLTHNAQWGGQNLEDETVQPTGFKNYMRIFTGSSGGEDALSTDQRNALGNHLGTSDLKATVNFGNWTLSNYWQFLWEDKSGLTPFNWRDGLFGLSLKNKNSNSLIELVNLEIVRTNDQDAKKTGRHGIIFFEPDNFLNHGVYKNGWTYNDIVIGSPIFLVLNEKSVSKSRVKNMINGVSINVSGRLNNVAYAVSYKGFSNHGTFFERIEPRLTVKSLLFTIALKKCKSSVLLRSEYNWGSYLGRNLGMRIEYQFDLSRLLSSKKPE